MKLSIEQLFWSKVRKRRNGCIEWLSSKNKGGYGIFRTKGKNIRAHRLAWILTHGEIPEHDSYHGICVLHKCDNRCCVNPEHLFLGTNHDNVKDMFAKGRHQCSDETKQKLSELHTGKNYQNKQEIE